MSGQWIKDIEIGSLPEPFDHFSEVMEVDLREVLPENLTDLVSQYDLANSVFSFMKKI